MIWTLNEYVHRRKKKQAASMKGSQTRKLLVYKKKTETSGKNENKK